VEYRSSASFLGLPLVHIATGALIHGRYRRGVATAWFAVGDIAIGVLFACGGVALGGISLGGAAIGLLPIGGFAFGLLALGGLALGIVAVGGAALAWYAAIGGLALAHHYALGGVALARSVITPASSGSLPISSIPHAPFHWSDALVLIGIAGAVLMVALSVQARRKE
jgi:zinc protease